MLRSSSLRSLTRVLGAFALVFLTGAHAQRSGSAFPPVFTGDLDQARIESAERNACLVIGFIQEGEETNDAFRSEVWQNPSFARAVADTVNLVVNDGEHPQIKIVDKREDGTSVEREVCSHYHTKTCAMHKRLMNIIYQEFNQEGDLKTPQLIVVSPDGKEFGRLIDNQDVKANVGLVLRAQKKAGTPITTLGLRVIKRQRKVASDAAKREDHAAAWHAWKKVLVHAQESSWATEAKTGVTTAEAGYKEQVAEAQASLEAGEIIAGWRQLRTLGTAWKDTPFAKEHGRLLKKVERDKRYKDVIAAEKKEVEAAELWAQCLEHIRAGEEKAALKIARKLIRRYRETEAGQAALAKFPELEK